MCPSFPTLPVQLCVDMRSIDRQETRCQSVNVWCHCLRVQIISAEVEEDGDEFVLTVSFKLHEPPRRRRHSDDDSSVATSDIGYRSRGQSRDLLHSYGIGRRPNSSHNDRRRRSLGL